ncbi:PAS domain S-box protein [Deinococcus alpinitundrae]|uniref:PAS domain S-box protein n=1 Tax=Deinococcus alpinitundrae TaxID=468913 RepID=UPI001379D69C|nr:PAS domain S-box protein [Deinococcus alpinitundrae]
MTPRLTSAPDPQLLSHAIAAYSVGIVMTDARQSDHPIVYVNPAFERLSGYAADELLGRNCRFLQGSDRNQPGVQEIRQAMAEQRSTTVTLRNYRKNGTLFYNELSLSPVHDAAGTLTHYLGFQNDVTEHHQAQKEQRSSEERFTKIFEAAPVAIVVSRVSDGHYLDVNPEFLRQSGYSREEVIGRTALELGLWVKPLERAEVWNLLQDQVKVRNREMQFRQKSGQLWDTLTSFVAVPIDGEACVATLIQDITREKQAQGVLAENEARYHQTAVQLQRTLDLSLDMITSIDAKGRFVTMSAACQHVLSYTAEELIGRFYYDFVHPDDRTITTVEHRNITAGQAATAFQNRYLRKDGTVVWLEWVTAVLADDPLLYCVVRDITQRKAAEEDQAFLASIVEASHDSIVGMDLGDTIRSWNAGAAQLYGYTAAEAIGQSITLIIPPELHAESAQIFSKVVQGERLEAFDSLRIAKDGRQIPVAVMVSAIMNAAGETVGLAKITRDITALQTAEGQVRSLNQHLEQQLRHVTGLREIDQAIASTQELSVTLSMIMDNVAQQLSADAVTLLLLDPDTLSLEYAGTWGFATPLQGSAVRLGSSLAGEVVLSRKAMNVPDLQSTLVPPEWREMLTRERLMAYYGAPLMSKGKVLGVIEVLHREPFEPSAAWLETFEMLTAQAAIAVDNAQLFTELERKNLELRLAYDETIEGWAHALDLRDKETEGHSRRVTEMAVALCRQLGVVPEQLVQVRRGALLHDIGKMGIPDAVLLKPGPLTDEEWVLMKKHPEYAVKLLSPIKFLRPALDIPQYHHEKWDGSGYPAGLKGQNIPVTARAFAVVDVYDALTSDRPYRQAWSRERALEHIQTGVGSHFDPQVVEAFLQLLQQSAP